MIILIQTSCDFAVLSIPIKSLVFYHSLWSGCLPLWFRMEILGGMVWTYEPNNCWYVIDLARYQDFT